MKQIARNLKKIARGAGVCAGVCVSITASLVVSWWSGLMLFTIMCFFVLP